ncbi:DUF2184 domain-containing protein [Anaerosolibacter sp.]|uniref:DUF2184 domain-containing protein n=1 Tax=Anaerosolibacter sp. TaxID=1872527 RepID=UPI0039EE3A9C
MAKERYDERDLASIQNSMNLDSNESIFFARELEHVKSRTYDIQFPELTAMRVIPVSSEVNPGAESIVYGQYEPTGYAKIISNYADDLPRADVVGKEFTAKVKSVGVSYGYSIQDVRAARLAGKPLEQRKASAARRANDQTINKVAYFGEANHGLVGLLNHPNIPEYTLPADGTGSSTKFKDKTPDQILRDLNAMVSQMIAATGGVEIPDTLLLPFDVYTDIATRRITDTNTTVLEFFIKQSPYIKEVMPIPELKAADNGDDVAIIYRRSPEKLTLEIPQAFEQFPVQSKGLEYVVPCHSRCAGVIVYYPLSLIKAVGI